MLERGCLMPLDLRFILLLTMLLCSRIPRLFPFRTKLKQHAPLQTRSHHHQCRPQLVSSRVTT